MMETWFEYTPQGVVTDEHTTVVSLGADSFRVSCEATSAISALVIEVDSSAAGPGPLVRVDGTIEIGAASVDSAVSVVLSRDADGATTLATRIGGDVSFVSTDSATVSSGTFEFTVVDPRVTRIAFRSWRSERSCWFGWWVPVSGSLVVPRMKRSFDYSRNSFWTNSDVAMESDRVFRAPKASVPAAFFVLSVDLESGATATGTVVEVRDGLSFGIEAASGEVFVVVDGKRQSGGLQLAAESAVSVVLYDDGSETMVSVRGGAESVSTRIRTGSALERTVMIGDSVARATLLVPASTSSSVPRGVDWAGWWSHVPVLLDGKGPGVVTWDAALEGARYAPGCALSGAMPWSARYAQERIEEVRASGMSSASGDGYVVWTGSAMAIVADPRGPTGARGETGREGEKGHTGLESYEEGPAGVRGQRGERGARGAQGPTGDAGEKGERGDAGLDAKGETGPRGQRGLQGPTGEKGPTGPPGGGPTGDRGERGEDGQAGERGKEGAVGPTGESGGEGPTGETGYRGETGPAGETGPKGTERGEMGATGQVGPTGYAGRVGRPGAPAFSGRYAPVARIPPRNVENNGATFAFSAPLAARTLTVSASSGLVHAAVRPYAATVGNYNDEVDTTDGAAFFDTVAGALTITYALSSSVTACGYELSTRGAVHKWTLEIDDVVRDDRTEESYALDTKLEFVRIAIKPVGCSVAKLTIVACAAGAKVRFILNHTSAP